jgi:hypothetical protein
LEVGKVAPGERLAGPNLGNRRLAKMFLEIVLGLLAELAERGAADRAAGAGQPDVDAQHERPFFARFGKTVKPYDITLGSSLGGRHDVGGDVMPRPT